MVGSRLVTEVSSSNTGLFKLFCIHNRSRGILFTGLFHHTSISVWVTGNTRDTWETHDSPGTGVRVHILKLMSKNLQWKPIIHICLVIYIFYITKYNLACMLCLLFAASSLYFICLFTFSIRIKMFNVVVINLKMEY